MRPETVEEFVARGGRVQKCEPAHATTQWQFITKDMKLRELRKLYRQVRNDPDKAMIVQAEIDKRIAILK